MIGVGIDSVDIGRFRELLARREALARRLFHPVEIESLQKRVDPVPGLAARFAAKEAVMKALGVGLGAFAFHEVTVLGEEGGRPRLGLDGAAAELSERAGVRSWHVSLTHTDQLAQAVVIAE